jgi:hypothetical protein
MLMDKLVTKFTHVTKQIRLVAVKLARRKEMTPSVLVKHLNSNLMLMENLATRSILVTERTIVLKSATKLVNHSNVLVMKTSNSTTTRRLVTNFTLATRKQMEIVHKHVPKTELKLYVTVQHLISNWLQMEKLVIKFILATNQRREVVIRLVPKMERKLCVLVKHLSSS